MSNIERFSGQPLVPLGGASSPLSSHGSADWMNQNMASALGLYEKTLSGRSLLFARGQGGIMSYGRDRHAIVCAPSRSGKGVSFVIPNLLTWRGSCFAIDPKGELAHFTSARRRSMGQAVYVLDPCRVSGQPSARFNPIEWLKGSHDLDTELRSIIAALTPDSLGTATFWNNAARELILGILLYQIAIPHEAKNLGRTYEILNLPQREWNRFLGEMSRCDGGSISLNTKVRRQAAWFESLHEEHQLYHRGTAQYHLAWLGIESARDMVSASDFDIRDLKRKTATIFVCIPAIDSDTYEGFTRVLTSLAIRSVYQWQVAPDSDELPILLMLDEFATTVGRMRVFDDAYTNIATYGGRFAIILQTIDQLQSLFPERKGNQSWRTVYENAGLRLFFNAQDETAEFVSKKLGVTTRSQIAPVGGSRQVQRQLHFPNEVAFPINENTGQHVPDACFAFAEGWPPIRARKLRYYADSEFAGQFNPEPMAAPKRPTGRTEWEQASLGYGAGVGESTAALGNAREVPKAPPAVSKAEEDAYAKIGGWSEFD